MPELLISTSPRTTLLWAAATEDLAAVRAILVRRNSVWFEAESDDGAKLPLVTNVEIGVDAYDSCMALAEGGFTFRRHPTEYSGSSPWLDELVGPEPGIDEDRPAVS